MMPVLLTPNPDNAATYWNAASLSDRVTVLAASMSRAFSPSQFPIQLRHELALRMDRPWSHLTEGEQEFLLLGMYDGIDCDRCGDFIPDVPDAVDRLWHHHLYRRLADHGVVAAALTGAGL